MKIGYYITKTTTDKNGCTYIEYFRRWEQRSPSFTKEKKRSHVFYSKVNVVKSKLRIESIFEDYSNVLIKICLYGKKSKRGESVNITRHS